MIMMMMINSTEKKKDNKIIIKEQHDTCITVYDANVIIMADYHMTYPECYVLLLSDVFENFQKDLH